MGSLTELRKRLSQLQLKSSKITLCQSECVDILLKISSLRNLNLFSTNDGMFLLTNKQVELEIIKILENEGGRAELFYISNCLDLNFNIIEKALSELLKKSTYNYYVEQGVLMNTIYLNNLIDSINCKLKGLGIIKLSDLSAEYNLSTAFICKILNNHMLHKLEGTLNKTHIENDSYRIILERSLKAALIATFVNVSISHFAHISCCDEDTAESILQDIISKNINIGIIRSNNFIPNSYILNKQREIINYFSSNGYIHKSIYNEFSSSDNTDEYSSIIYKSIALCNVFIKKSYLQQVKFLVDEAMTNCIWRLLDSILPSTLSFDDIQMLIKLATNINVDTEYHNKSTALLYQDYIFIPQKYLTNLITISSHYILYMLKCEDENYIWTTNFVNYAKVCSHLIYTLIDTKSVSSMTKGKKKKRTIDLSPVQPTIINREIQQFNVEEMFNSIVSAPNDVLSAIIIDEINIKEYFNDTEYSFSNLWNIIYDHSEFSAFIFEEIIHDFNQLYLEKYAKPQKTDLTLDLSEQIEFHYNTFHYSYKGLKFLGVTDWNNPISIYICRNILMKALEQLIEIYQLKSNINVGDLSDKKMALDKLTKHGLDTKNLITFYESIVSRNLESVVGICYQAAEDVYENIRIPNKKNEKEYLANKIKHVKSQAKTVSEDDHLSICHLFVTYVLLLNGYFVEFPVHDWSVKYMANMLSTCKRLKCYIAQDPVNHFNLYAELKERQDSFPEYKLKELNQSSESLLSFIKE